MIENEQAEEILLILDDKLSKTLSVLKEGYASVRAGRANPHILDKVTFDYYGAQTPVTQAASVSVQEGRCLVISPWDGSILKSIEKAIQVANLGINPTNDGKVIRLVFPELTEERRRDLSKQVRKMGEDSKVAARNTRRDAMDGVKKLKNDKVLSEDEAAAVEKEIEKAVQDAIAKIDGAVSAKEKEIMTV